MIDAVRPNESSVWGDNMTHGDIRRNASQETRAEISRLSKQNPLRSVFLYAQVYISIMVIVGVSLAIDNVLVTVLAVMLIAGRQHSLYILNHDGSHYGLFRNKKLNKYVASVLSNFVMFHHPEAWSFVQWRRVHMLHHKHLFTDLDPNYVGRKKQGDTRKSPTTKELLLSVISGGWLAAKDFLAGRQDYSRPGDYQITPGTRNHIKTLFVPFKEDKEMEQERIQKLIFFTVAILVILTLNIGVEFLLYWIIPMYTFYPMILRFHDLTEHRWDLKTDTLSANTRSRKDGIWEKIFLTGLPRGYHREHHVYPQIAVVDLPKVNAMLKNDGLVPEALTGVTGLVEELRDIKQNMSLSSVH